MHHSSGSCRPVASTRAFRDDPGHKQRQRRRNRARPAPCDAQQLRCERNYARARATYEESVSLLRRVGATRDLASVLHNLGHALLHLGELDAARELFVESMSAQQSVQNRPGMAECLIGFAAERRVISDWLGMLQQLGLVPPPATGREQISARS